MEIDKEPILLIGPSLEIVKKIRSLTDLVIKRHNEIADKANKEIREMRNGVIDEMEILHTQLLSNLFIPQHERAMWIIDDRYVDAHDLAFMYYTEELAKELAMRQRDVGGITNN